jgi:hypothetical protein
MGLRRQAGFIAICSVADADVVFYSRALRTQLLPCRHRHRVIVVGGEGGCGRRRRCRCEEAEEEGGEGD